jgi:hypothetical protein
VEHILKFYTRPFFRFLIRFFLFMYGSLLLFPSFTGTFSTASADETPPPYMEYEVYNGIIVVDNQMPPTLFNGMANYYAIFERHNICSLVQSGAIDEVWIWAGNGNGQDKPNMLEWATSGPGWTNTPFWGVVTPNCGKVVTTMTYNYNLDVGFALHSYGHRMEAAFMNYIPCDFSTGTWPWVGNPHWTDECNGPLSDRYGFVARPFAGNTMVAGCGDIHHPPNITNDDEYIYWRSDYQQSICQDWSRDSSAQVTTLNCETWSCTQAGYMLWWMQNIPGYQNTNRTDNGALQPNWWPYLFGELPVAPPPTNTSTKTATPTQTHTNTATSTATTTSTPSTTIMPSHTASSTPSATTTPSFTPSTTATPTASEGPTSTPTASRTSIPSPTSPGEPTTTPLITVTPTTPSDEYRLFQPLITKPGLILPANNPVQYHATGPSHVDYRSHYESVAASSKIISDKALFTNADQPAVTKRTVYVIHYPGYGGTPLDTIATLNAQLIQQLKRASIYHGYRYETRPQAVFLGQDGGNYAGQGCSPGTVADNIHIRASGLRTDMQPINYRVTEPAGGGVWANPCNPLNNWLVHPVTNNPGQVDLYFKPFRDAPDGTVYSVQLGYSDGETIQFTVIGSRVFP